jgi:hypothetical protein
VVPRDVGVEDAEPLDHATVGVREQGVGNAVLAGELSEDVRRVIADGKRLDPVPVERLQVTLQLDELRLAEPSPRGASVKQKKCLVSAPGLGEAHDIPGLVRKREIGHRFADCRPGREPVVYRVPRVDQLGHAVLRPLQL